MAVNFIGGENMEYLGKKYWSSETIFQLYHGSQLY